MERSKKILVFGAAVVIALLAVTFFMADNFTSTTNADGETEMILTIPDGDCTDDTCTVAHDAAFTLAVEMVTTPAEYILAQSFVVYGPDLTYNMTEGRADEFVWPDCNDVVAVRDQLDQVPNSILHGCLTGLFPPLPISTFTGTLLELSMTCSSSDSTTEVELLPEGDDRAGTSGALFKTPDDTGIIPKVSNLTVVCGAGVVVPTNTPGPTDTPGPATDTPGPATDTPVPTETPVPTSTPDQPCGDVNGGGDVNSVDAAIILQFTAGLISDIERLAKPDNADVNGDGEVTSVDAALVLQKEAGRIDQDDLTC